MRNPKRPGKKHYINIAKGMTTDPEVINSIMTRVMNWTSNKAKRIITGIGNEVYLVTNFDKKDEKVILRINHNKGIGLYREQWAMEKVSAQEVPVPKIISLNTTKDSKGKTLTFCIEEYLEGKNLSDLLDEGISDQDKRLYGLKAGKILAKIHKVETKGCGQFVTNGISSYETLKESMQQHKDKQTLLETARSVDLNKQIVEKAVEIVDGVKTEESPHLIHIDYAPKHIFVKNKEIVGVIDFEICLSGTASMDINRWRSQDNRISLGYLIDGYEKVRKLPSNFWGEMFIVQVHSALRTMLFHHNKTKDIKEVRKAADELEKLINTLKPLKT